MHEMRQAALIKPDGASTFGRATSRQLTREDAMCSQALSFREKF